jgi:hypothetical protein
MSIFRKIETGLLGSWGYGRGSKVNGENGVFKSGKWCT